MHTIKLITPKATYTQHKVSHTFPASYKQQEVTDRPNYGLSSALKILAQGKHQRSKMTIHVMFNLLKIIQACIWQIEISYYFLVPQQLKCYRQMQKNGKILNHTAHQPADFAFICKTIHDVKDLNSLTFPACQLCLRNYVQ